MIQILYTLDQWQWQYACDMPGSTSQYNMKWCLCLLTRPSYALATTTAGNIMPFPWPRQFWLWLNPTGRGTGDCCIALAFSLLLSPIPCPYASIAFIHTHMQAPGMTDNTAVPAIAMTWNNSALAMQWSGLWPSCPMKCQDASCPFKHWSTWGLSIYRWTRKGTRMSTILLVRTQPLVLPYLHLPPANPCHICCQLFPQMLSTMSWENRWTLPTHPFPFFSRCPVQLTIESRILNPILS